MKALLIIDSLGGNPAFSPPRRDRFATDEEFEDALAQYDVPPDITVKAGTIISGRGAWMHCICDASGLVLVKQKDPHDGKMKPLPKRVARGVVRAVPVDDGCRAAVAKHVRHAAQARRVAVEIIEREIAAGVAQSRAEQAAIDADRRDSESVTAPVPVERAPV
jgi:hypothetical protein